MAGFRKPLSKLKVAVRDIPLSSSPAPTPLVQPSTTAPLVRKRPSAQLRQKKALLKRPRTGASPSAEVVSPSTTPSLDAPQASPPPPPAPIMVDSASTSTLAVPLAQCSEALTLLNVAPSTEAPPPPGQESPCPVEGEDPRLSYYAPPYPLQPSNVEMAEDFQWSAPEALAALRPLFLKVDGESFETLPDAEAHCSAIMEHALKAVTGVFALARRADHSQRVAVLRTTEADTLRADRRQMSVSLRQFKAEADKALSDLQAAEIKALRLFNEKRDVVNNCVTLGDERDKLQGQLAEALASRDLADKRARVAEEEVAELKRRSEEDLALARREAEEAKGALEALKADTKRMIDEACRQTVESEEMAFAAGVDVASYLMNFTEEYRDEMPLLPERLEQFKARYDLNPLWFSEAAKASDD